MFTYKAYLDADCIELRDQEIFSTERAACDYFADHCEDIGVAYAVLFSPKGHRIASTDHPGC